MELWKGSLAPFRKHISSVTYVPLEGMSKEDWDILDFPDLRPQARARIVRQIERGALRGFFRVRYDMHKRSHGGKPVYFYPATDAEIDAFDNGEFDEAGFENFDDFERDVEESEKFNSGYDTLAFLVFTSIFVLQAQIAAATENAAVQEDAPNWAVPLVILSMLYGATREQLVDIAKYYGYSVAQRIGKSNTELVALILAKIEELDTA